ncbi:hypothetical protein BH11ACT2_BH11ACT2_11070 [soil metagenome]
MLNWIRTRSFHPTGGDFVALSENDRYILDTRIKAIVTDEVIAEQRERPFGPQSTAMIEVLDFLRRSPDPDLPRYIVLDTGDGFSIALRSDHPGAAPAPLEDAVSYATRGEAEHAVFIKRLTDYGVIS